MHFVDALTESESFEISNEEEKTGNSVAKLKKSKMTETDGEIYHVLGLEESIL